MQTAVQFVPSNDTPVYPGPSTWSDMCNVSLASDPLMVASGYQQWTQSAGKGKTGRTRALETLARYRPGGAVTALAQAAAAARSCTSYVLGSAGTFRVIEPVTSSATLLTYCQQKPSAYLCARLTVRADHVSQVVGFGSTQREAQDLTSLLAGLADAQLEAAGL